MSGMRSPRSPESNCVRLIASQYGSDFISAMPTNLYGPNDNFDLTSSHVLPALIRKFHDAKNEGRNAVEIWGTGTPMREFLHVDDLADACLHLMDHYSDDSHINVGTGMDITIRDLAYQIRDVVHPGSELVFDTSKPDGTPRKVLDTTRLTATGWTPSITLAEGIESTYKWFLANRADLRGADPLRAHTPQSLPKRITLPFITVVQVLGQTWSYRSDSEEKR
jgi:GDP-L-fucose synthase